VDEVTGETIPAHQVFMPHTDPKVQPQSAIYRIRENPARDAAHQDIIRLEQIGAMKFEDILAGKADAEGQKQAQALWNSLPPGDLAIHKEALLRRYSAQERRVYREIEMDQYNQIASFAVAMNSHEQFGGSATRAHDFAQQFAQMDGDTRITTLVNTLNITTDEAFDVVMRYHEVEELLDKKHTMMKQHPEYVTETRLKDFHVAVVFPRQKDGTIPTPGYYDFDSIPEAQAFIDDQVKQGNKPGKIKDYATQRWNYKPVSGSLDDIIDRVTTQRRELVKTIIYGKLSAEDQDLVVHALSNQPRDIKMENDVVLASKNDMKKRNFTPGREDLDMIDQFKKSTQRRAAAISRKRTDTLFRLYKNDAELAANPTLFSRMEQFKDGVRIQDTEAQKNIGKAGFVAYIMGNVSSALIEMFQFPITLSPILMEHGASALDAYRIPAKMMKMATHAALRRLRQKSDEDIWEGEHYVLLREQERQGRSNQMKHHDLAMSNKAQEMSTRFDSTTGEIGSKNPALHIGSLTFNFLNNLYGFFNRINAELSTVATYETLKKSKYGNKQPDALQIKELQNQAMMISDVANGSLQRLGRPGFLTNQRTAGYRNAGSMYWSLQSFVNAQVANQLRFMQKSINTDGKFTKAESVQARKAMVGLLGAQFTGMGIMGFTLMPAMAKIVQETLGFDLEDELKALLYDEDGKTASEKTFMGEVAMNGLLTAIGTPWDFGPRISIGGIGPLTAFNGFDANQLGGPLVGLAANAMKDMKKVQAGTINLGEASINLLPMGLRRGVRMSFIDDGAVYDANKNYMFDATAAEQVGAWMGFSSTRYRQTMKSRMENDEALKADLAGKGRSGNQVTLAQKSSPSMVQSLLTQGADAHGMDRYAYANYVAQKQVAKQIGPDPREGAGPASQLAKRLYPSPVPNASEETRYHMTNAALSNLGVTPRLSNTKLNNARRQDYMQQLDPTLTSGAARRQMREERSRPRMGFGALLGDFD
jgi:hypothetical protein